MFSRFSSDQVFLSRLKSVFCVGFFFLLAKREHLLSQLDPKMNNVNKDNTIIVNSFTHAPAGPTFVKLSERERERVRGAILLKQKKNGRDCLLIFNEANFKEK